MILPAHPPPPPQTQIKNVPSHLLSFIHQFSRQLIDQRTPHIRDDVALRSPSDALSPPARRTAPAQSEYILDDADFGRRRVQSNEARPIVHDQTAPEYVAPAIDGTGDEGYLQQR